MNRCYELWAQQCGSVLSAQKNCQSTWTALTQAKGAINITRVTQQSPTSPTCPITHKGKWCGEGCLSNQPSTAAAYLARLYTDLTNTSLKVERNLQLGSFSSGGSVSASSIVLSTPLPSPPASIPKKVYMYSYLAAQEHRRAADACFTIAVFLQL